MAGKIINIITVILTVGLFVSFVILCSSIRIKNSVYEATPRTFYYTLQRQDYCSMVDSYHSNMAYGFTEDKNSDYTPYYAFCDYYENAFKYNIYNKLGDNARRDMYYKKMMEAKPKLEEIEVLIPEIDKMFGVEN